MSLGRRHTSERGTVPLCRQQDETIVQPIMREESGITGSLNDEVQSFWFLRAANSRLVSGLANLPIPRPIVVVLPLSNTATLALLPQIIRACK